MRKSLNLTKIEKAVVPFHKKSGGRAVLIPGNLLLTAAHCVQHVFRRNMNLHEVNPVIITIKDSLIPMDILFVDFISDIAILTYFQDMGSGNFGRFMDFCLSTKPIPLSKLKYEVDKHVPILILNKNMKWVNASATIPNPLSHLLHIKSEKRIVPGSSGGPIINERGELVSINSNINGGGIERLGISPIPLLTLPKWILQLSEL